MKLFLWVNACLLWMFIVPLACQTKENFKAIHDPVPCPECPKCVITYDELDAMPLDDDDKPLTH